MITHYLFYFLAFVAVLSALLVVLDKNPVHSVLYLVLTFFAVSGHYLLLNAQFLAIVNVIVYAGAIMVLFLYVIMMLNMNKDVEPDKRLLPKVIAVLSGGAFLYSMIAVLKKFDNSLFANTSDNQIGTVEVLGKILFNQYMLPFEICSILFLSAMVGAVYLSKKEI